MASEMTHEFNVKLYKQMQAKLSQASEVMDQFIAVAKDSSDISIDIVGGVIWMHFENENYNINLWGRFSIEKLRFDWDYVIYCMDDDDTSTVRSKDTFTMWQLAYDEAKKRLLGKVRDIYSWGVDNE